MLRILLFALSVSSCLIGSAVQPACAQAAGSGWMDRASSALNSEAGQQFVQSVTQGQAAATANPKGLTNAQVNNGLKEALNIGTTQVVTQLGKQGGFSADPKIRIPLPLPLQKTTGLLTKMGMGTLSTDLENRMNLAAEQAMPEASVLFVNAIKAMTIQDAQAILNGSNTAATQYLRKTMGNQLAQKMQPLVTRELSQAGAIQAYDAMAGQLPLAATMKNTLNSYVTNKAIDGVFYYVGQQETAIRTDPAKQTTALLKTVFGK